MISSNGIGAVGAQEAIQRLLGLAHHRFVLVELGVERARPSTRRRPGLAQDDLRMARILFGAPKGALRKTPHEKSRPRCRAAETSEIAARRGALRRPVPQASRPRG